MAWCQVHVLLIVHMIHKLYKHLYIFKELTGYGAIDWVSVFCQKSTLAFAIWSVIF